MTTTEDRIIAEKDGSFTVNVEGGTFTTGFKELTDDEIVDIGTEFLAPKDCDIFTFARAILRKAQEQ
jgi:prefoldin subunit 5